MGWVVPRAEPQGTGLLQRLRVMGEVVLTVSEVSGVCVCVLNKVKIKLYLDYGNKKEIFLVWKHLNVGGDGC